MKEVNPTRIYAKMFKLKENVIFIYLNSYVVLQYLFVGNCIQDFDPVGWDSRPVGRDSSTMGRDKQGGISFSTNQRFCLHFCPKPIRMRKTLHHMKFVNKHMGLLQSCKRFFVFLP